MNLYVGLKLKTINNDLAEIVGINGPNIRILYRGKIITVNKYSFNKLNLKSCIVEDRLEKIENKIQDIKNSKKEEDIKPFHKSCENCMERKNGNCMGYNKICEDYRPSPEISKEEIARWPKEGDASYFRTHKFAKSRN